VLPALKELGIAFVLYSPLCKGFLTGMINENTVLGSSDVRFQAPQRRIALPRTSARPQSN
jgi:aryl-alcohol dehydrogenase-like predicted oxidoreductase